MQYKSSIPLIGESYSGSNLHGLKFCVEILLTTDFFTSIISRHLG